MNFSQIGLNKLEEEPKIAVIQSIPNSFRTGPCADGGMAGNEVKELQSIQVVGDLTGCNAVLSKYWIAVESKEEVPPGVLSQASLRVRSDDGPNH